MRRFVTFGCGLVLLALCAGTRVQAQALTLEQAVQRALEQNFDIRLAQNAAEQAANDVTWGNAGFLPRVTINGALNYNQQDRRLQTRAERDSAGNVIATPLTVVRGVNTFGGNVGVQASYTVFDGLRNVAFWRRLKLLRDNSTLATAQAVERVVGGVVVAYYDIVRQQQTLRLQQGARALAAERSRLAQDREEVGAGTRLDYLQSRVDLNAAESAVLRQQGTLATALIALNELMGQAPDAPLTLADTLIAVDTLLDRTSLMAEQLRLSPTLLSARQSVSISEQQLGELRGGRLPTVSLTGGYTFFQQNAGVLAQGFNTFPLYIQTLGPQLGVQISYPIFDGLNLRRQITNSRLDLSAARLRLEQAELTQRAALDRAWVSYRNSLELLRLERENQTVAERNVEVALDRFKIGASTGLELRTAQNALVEAQLRLVQALYSAKVAETDLVRLSGALASRAGQLD